MSRTLLALSLAAALLAAAPSWAQVDDEQEADAGGASQQVEESDEAFRRRMELEDARQRDPSYVDAQANYKRELEKIDGLPEASRDHIREQLIDVIMENGEWTPDDARRDYPYSPSPAARDDAALAEQEQEAWDEQIEKYHAREAAAFGALRPAQGSGAEGSQGSAGANGAGSAGSEGSPGESASGSSAASSATYEPYEAARRADEERTSTAGVSQSALDFILGQGDPQPAPSPPAQGAEPSAAAPTPASAPETAAAQTAAASTPETSQNDAEADDAPRDLRGILAIEDLDKLGDAVRPPPPPEEEPETTPPDDG